VCVCVCAELSAWSLFFVFFKLFSVSVVVADIFWPAYFRGEEFVCVCLCVCMFCFVSSFRPRDFLFFSFFLVLFFFLFNGRLIDWLPKLLFARKVLLSLSLLFWNIWMSAVTLERWLFARLCHSFYQLKCFSSHRCVRAGLNNDLVRWNCLLLLRFTSSSCWNG
jgi:hypothetical protein